MLHHDHKYDGMVASFYLFYIVWTRRNVTWIQNTSFLDFGYLMGQRLIYQESYLVLLRKYE